MNYKGLMHEGKCITSMWFMHTLTKKMWLIWLVCWKAATQETTRNGRQAHHWNGWRCRIEKPNISLKKDTYSSSNPKIT